MTPTATKLSLQGISKIYGETFYANKNINFELRQGEVHALVGENGAGKTTLMKILFGLETASAGKILLDREEITISGPADAKKHRIAMVHQHFMLEDQISIGDHLQIEINSIKKTWGFASLGLHKFQIDDVMKKLKLNLPLNTPIGRLSVVQKQKVETLKTLLFDPEILIFDEPTAVLPPDEIASFYQLVRDLKRQRKCIALITHKISDVIENADYVTVLRHGEVRFSSPVKDTSEREIAQHMIGDNAFDAAANEPSTHFKLQDGTRPSPLDIRVFSTASQKNTETSATGLQNINITVRHGEIVALAGVDGNGQTALLSYLIRPETLLEAAEKNQAVSGDITLLGQPILKEGQICASDASVRRSSIGFIGPDRLHDSTVAEYDPTDHFRLLPHYRRPFFLEPTAPKLLSDTITDLDIRPAKADLKMSQYSGGNQQKWVVGRETSHLPELLFACHPTRGVDFAASERIHKILLDIKNRNRSVILLSSDLDEVLKISDRILVFFEGRILAEFKTPFDRQKIGHAFGGII